MLNKGLTWLARRARVSVEGNDLDGGRTLPADAENPVRRKRLFLVIALVLVLALAGGGALLAFTQRVTLELVAPREAHLGQPIEGLDILLTNNKPKWLRVSYPRPVMFFEVVDTEGNVIWESDDFVVLVGYMSNLGPFQTIALSSWQGNRTGSWDLRDSKGVPVPPGEYVITGRPWVNGAGKLEAVSQPLRISN